MSSKLLMVMLVFVIGSLSFATVATSKTSTPPFAPWMNRPTAAKFGQVVTYHLHIRNNLNRPLQLQGGLSYLKDQGTPSSEMSIGGWFPALSSNIPFNNVHGLCGCLGKPWMVTLAPHQVKSYFFRVRLKAEHDLCPVATFYAAGLNYALDTSHTKCTAVLVTGTA